MYELHKQTTATVHQVPDLGQVQTFDNYISI